MLPLIIIYFFLSIPAYLFFPKDKKPQFYHSNNFFLAIGALCLMIVKAFSLGVAFYSGYLSEQFAFYRRAMSSYYYFIILLWLITVSLALFNFSLKYRTNLNYQKLVMISLIGYLVLTISKHDFGISMTMVPGDISIYFLGSAIAWYPFTLVASILINFILIRKKLLPEFK